DAAAWMSAKGTPAWDVARIDRTFAETFVLRSELLVASCSDGIVGCCTLSAEDPEFWPDALKGEAAYLHKLAVRRTHAGRGVSSALIGVLSQNRRNFRHPSSSPATSASRSIILPSLWKV
ncbi:GNAT family N-acetyltransferase, partial [Pseudomonas aeruginosa]